MLAASVRCLRCCCRLRTLASGVSLGACSNTAFLPWQHVFEPLQFHSVCRLLGDDAGLGAAMFLL